MNNLSCYSILRRRRKDEKKSLVEKNWTWCQFKICYLIYRMRLSFERLSKFERSLPSTAQHQWRAVSIFLFILSLSLSFSPPLFSYYFSKTHEFEPAYLKLFDMTKFTFYVSEFFCGSYSVLKILLRCFKMFLVVYRHRWQLDSLLNKCDPISCISCYGTSGNCSWWIHWLIGCWLMLILIRIQ